MPVNDNPEANPDTRTITEEQTIAVTGNVVSPNAAEQAAGDVADTDVESNTITVTSVAGQSVNTSGTTVVNGTYGKLTIDASGKYSYQLNAGVDAVKGQPPLQEVLEYTISDGSKRYGFVAVNIHNHSRE